MKNIKQRANALNQINLKEAPMEPEKLLKCLYKHVAPTEPTAFFDSYRSHVFIKKLKFRIGSIGASFRPFLIFF